MYIQLEQKSTFVSSLVGVYQGSYEQVIKL